METSAKGGQAKPKNSNATSFNWCFFTDSIDTHHHMLGVCEALNIDCFFQKFLKIFKIVHFLDLGASEM